MVKHEAYRKLKIDPLHEEINGINLDSTSPRDALEFLYKLKEALVDKKKSKMLVDDDTLHVRGATSDHVT